MSASIEEIADDVQDVRACLRCRARAPLC